ncbi:hypothetical protein PGQ11_005530 [Apiospora arundinis]|uniref:Uncharacterized protein n=1 Tax=Apiospora arundinis TaxID=335852 RepID=A0ABR2JBE5_9PEZI
MRWPPYLAHLKPRTDYKVLEFLFSPLLGREERHHDQVGRGHPAVRLDSSDSAFVDQEPRVPLFHGSRNVGKNPHGVFIMPAVQDAVQEVNLRTPDRLRREEVVGLDHDGRIEVYAYQLLGYVGPLLQHQGAVGYYTLVPVTDPEFLQVVAFAASDVDHHRASSPRAGEDCVEGVYVHPGIEDVVGMQRHGIVEPLRDLRPSAHIVEVGSAGPPEVLVVARLAIRRVLEARRGEEGVEVVEYRHGELVVEPTAVPRWESRVAGQGAGPGCRLIGVFADLGEQMLRGKMAN